MPVSHEPDAPPPPAASSAAHGDAADHYARMHAGFGWSVPEFFNIAQVCCMRWAEAPGANERVAIRAHGAKAGAETLSYAALQEGANRLCHVLRGLGVERGDRVAIVMPQ
ncbi:MAG TPA: AMP-binding protein, partial [Lautropia sp.]|nr:AMP-binding protein [Lautropia sp.]